jgi:hypothetical protein
MKTWTIKTMMVAGLLVFTLSLNAADQASTNAPTSKAEAAPRISKSVTDVVKLSKAGLEQRVIESYLEQSGSIVPPTADEIVHLREQGVSQEIIALMIKRTASLRTQVIQNASKEDRTWEAMLDARQRSMFTRDYPPLYAGPVYVKRHAPPYGYDAFGNPISGHRGPKAPRR